MQTAEPRSRDDAAATRPNYRTRNFPLNTWWVAARSAEITTKPLGRRLLDLPMVLYRTAGGRVVAADDRCPHRWAPLSLGSVSGDDLVCRYHGLHFGPSGFCTKIPSQDRIAANVRVRTYPTIDRYGFVWVWPGDPALTVSESPPDLDFLEGTEAWHRVDGEMRIEANYLMFRENVLDLTHLSHLHASTAGVTDYDRGPDVTIDGNIVTTRQEFLNCTLAPLYRSGLDISPDHRMNRFTSGSSISPALQFNSLRFVEPQPADGARSEFRLHILHFATPETMSSSHYWWTMARDHGGPWDVEKVRAGNEAVFAEDQWMLEAIQKTADADALNSTPGEISVAADRAALAVRRVMARRVAEELSSA